MIIENGYYLHMYYIVTCSKMADKEGSYNYRGRGRSPLLSSVSITNHPCPAKESPQKMVIVNLLKKNMHKTSMKYIY